MKNVLIGSTGFVGSTLLRHARFDLAVHRSNLSELRGIHCEKLVCAGLPAAKWIANKEPKADEENMLALFEVMKTVTAHRVQLISTIDVYPNPSSGDEKTNVDLPNHPYGSHRRTFEKLVFEHFAGNTTIIRLPALFGVGLKKNVIYDLLQNNEVHKIDPNGRFQWYPTSHLHTDLQKVEQLKLELVNFATPPIATQEIVDRFFPQVKLTARVDVSATYNVRTKHDIALAGSDGYLLKREQVLASMGHYIKGEMSTA